MYYLKSNARAFKKKPTSDVKLCASNLFVLEKNVYEISFAFKYHLLLCFSPFIYVVLWYYFCHRVKKDC